MAWATGDTVVLQMDKKSKPAFVFAGSDDYLQVDAWAVARTAANDTAGTITAWVNPADETNTFTILAAGDANAVEYIHFSIEAGTLFAACNDATTMQWDINSTDEVCDKYKWTHVALVQDGNRPKMYVNGVEVALTITTSTDLTEWFNNLDGLDQGLIGGAEVSGDASVTQDFKGAISNVKYWSSALTAAQILDDYRGKDPETIGTTLTHWWPMFDNSGIEEISEDDATIVNAVYFDPSYSALTAYLKWEYTVVVADMLSVSTDSNSITCVVTRG